MASSITLIVLLACVVASTLAYDDLDVAETRYGGRGRHGYVRRPAVHYGVKKPYSGGHGSYGKPVVPVRSYAHGKPVVPVHPVSHGKPVVPVHPVTYGKPVVPVHPVAHGKPVVPVHPVGHGKPVVPIVPVYDSPVPHPHVHKYNKHNRRY